MRAMKNKNKKDYTAGNPAHRRQILNESSNFIVQEAYKSLRTNIRFYVRDKDCKRFCITSASAGEGKSITLLNLAISIAQGGQKVLLIDADLRRPAVARLLVEKATPGLSEVLSDQATVEESIRKEIYPNLDVLFSGEMPPNPSELLSSETMEKLVKKVSGEYDYVLVDTPPVNVVSDACVAANLLDGVLLLVWQGRTKKDAVKQAVNNLELTGSRILGFVLNGVKMEKKREYGYYYY